MTGRIGTLQTALVLLALVVCVVVPFLSVWMSLYLSVCVCVSLLCVTLSVVLSHSQCV